MIGREGYMEAKEYSSQRVFTYRKLCESHCCALAKPMWLLVGRLMAWSGFTHTVRKHLEIKDKEGSQSYE